MKLYKKLSKNEQYNICENNVYNQIENSKIPELLKWTDGARLNNVYDMARMNSFAILSELANSKCPHMKPLIIDISQVFKQQNYSILAQEKLMIDLLLYEKWIYMVRELAASDIHSFEIYDLPLCDLLRRQGVLIFKGEKLIINAECAVSVELINKSDEIPDDVLISLKIGGIDDVSRLKKEYILSAVDGEIIKKVQTVEDEKCQFSALRWYIRGLNIDLAIRKVLLDEQYYNLPNSDRTNVSKRNLTVVTPDENSSSEHYKRMKKILNYYEDFPYLKRGRFEESELELVELDWEQPIKIFPIEEDL